MQRKNHVLLNVGLENNPRKVDEILNGLGPVLGTVAEFHLDTSYWKEATERTLIVSVETSFKLSTIIGKIESLCLSMQQDAIAARIFEDNFKRNIDLLIYSPTHKGERMDFENEFFKKLPIK